jgi:hypothetical protein
VEMGCMNEIIKSYSGSAGHPLLSRKKWKVIIKSII